MLIDTYNKNGEITGKVELRDDIFGIEPNEHSMHLAVVVYLAHQRQGTAKTKTRAEVSGGGKKPWRQKGRGTARSGSSRSPVWVGGGTIHGPKPHKYNLQLPRKVKQLARKSALSARASENNIIVVDDFQLPEIKTKLFADVLDKLNIYYEKTLVLLPEHNQNLYMSVRNIPGVTIFPANLASTYDILNHKKILLFKGAIDTIVNTFNN